MPFPAEEEEEGWEYLLVETGISMTVVVVVVGIIMETFPREVGIAV